MCPHGSARCSLGCLRPTTWIAGARSPATASTRAKPASEFAGIGLCEGFWTTWRRPTNASRNCLPILASRPRGPASPKSATLCGAIVNSVRLLTGRARPSNTEAVQEWNGLWRGRESLLFNSQYHSFPSGHTGVAFALFGVILFADRRHGWWALLAAAAIAWSRIYLNVHHLSDVMAGAFVGLITAFLVWERLEPRVDRFLGRFPS